MQPNERMKSSPPWLWTSHHDPHKNENWKIALRWEYQKEEEKTLLLYQKISWNLQEKENSTETSIKKSLCSPSCLFLEDGQFSWKVEDLDQLGGGDGSTVSNIKTGILRGVYIASENIAGIRQIGHSSSGFLKNQILTATSFQRHEWHQIKGGTTLDAYLATRLLRQSVQQRALIFQLVGDIVQKEPIRSLSIWKLTQQNMPPHDSFPENFVMSWTCEIRFSGTGFQVHSHEAHQ